MIKTAREHIVHNCSNKKGHIFFFIKDKEKIIKIKKQHPRMVYALWECCFCGKIKQSM